MTFLSNLLTIMYFGAHFIGLFDCSPVVLELFIVDASATDLKNWDNNNKNPKNNVYMLISIL